MTKLDYTTEYESEKYSVGSKFKNKNGDTFIIYGRSIDKKTFYFGKIVGCEELIKISQTSLFKCDFKNKNTRNVYGKGCIGFGKYDSKLNKKAYKLWVHVLERCYDEKLLNKFPKYRDVTVCEEWLNFQNFANWYEQTYPKDKENIKFELDKDLLQQGVENKIYSPETAIWIPHNLNSFLRFELSNSNKYLYRGVKVNYNKYGVSIGDGNSKKIYCGLYETLDEAIRVANTIQNFKIDCFIAFMKKFELYDNIALCKLENFKKYPIENNLSDRVIDVKNTIKNNILLKLGD